MKNYIAIIEGEGEGCDYTIGCNLTYEFISANSIDEVREKIIKEYYYNDPDDVEEGEDEMFEPEIGIERLTICEIKNKYEFDDIAEKMEYLIKNQKEISDEKIEKAEYERLKKKFGDK